VGHARALFTLFTLFTRFTLFTLFTLTMVQDGEAWDTLARLFSRLDGDSRGLSEEDGAEMSAAGFAPLQQAVLARLFTRPGGCGDLGNDDASALRSAGFTHDQTAALARAFKRPGETHMPECK
jgi:hypothetical protein